MIHNPCLRKLWVKRNKSTPPCEHCCLTQNIVCPLWLLTLLIFSAEAKQANKNASSQWLESPLSHWEERRGGGQLQGHFQGQLSGV